jgi:hypothetical protein
MSYIEVKVFCDGEPLYTRLVSREVLLLIGSRTETHVRVPEAESVHTIVDPLGREVRVLALGATPPTLLNGKQVLASAPLCSGDCLRIGSYLITFEFVDLGDN